MMLEFEVPLPPAACQPNGQHGHWSTKNGARRLYRSEVALIAQSAARVADWPIDPGPVRLSLVFGTRHGPVPDGRYRPRDFDNAVAAFKGARDGMRDAGLFADDDHRHLLDGGTQIDPTRGPGVYVRLEVIS